VIRFDIITIFPDYFAPLDVSLLGKARERGLVELRIHDLREHADDVHRTVDDSPYGGGPGMLMRPEPWGRALDGVLADPPARPDLVADPVAPILIVPTPSGRRFEQSDAVEWAAQPWLVMACGRYEGIDARVVSDAATRMRVEEVSIGDYVLAGGEVAALVMIEAIARLMPGFMGNAASPLDDSFSVDSALVEAPAYTRPATWRGLAVPEVLLSGDHAAIARWRHDESVRRTQRYRPDLAGETGRITP
jgi:tRNA (guanine37-N1)-methyltransferase